ncbi:GNAT family N-acetyltransferase [Frigoriflavimonas asaccharolytica]|uniref:Phosphinothricin acetyltransferase n=1 Tax=Frigoriflavimonas asaccharolytica TaxID=2735899 RepID=A0A8J8G9Q7_9FLAO|nr:GNAT family N-acetyltransferase [Frigoriflavimonas asaccharolytica]NRS91567.1 phosphinothricin acetyltransferase [Frigoriflavimonas asaccharolytica]
MNYKIRPMLPKDATRVLQIFQQGIDGGNATFDQHIPTWEQWDEEHVDQCRFSLLDENDKVVGWCALLKVSSRECFQGVAELSIYVDNDNHGKGLGTILLEKIILDSEENGFWTLQSGIFPENTGSIHLHEKLGFRIIGNREKIGKSNGKWRDIILMERRSTTVGI